MTNLCEDHNWAGEGDCPKCESAFSGLVPAQAEPSDEEIKILWRSKYRSVTIRDTTQAIEFARDLFTLRPAPVAEPMSPAVCRAMARFYLRLAEQGESATPARFSCHLERDFGRTPCGSDCGKLRCMYPSELIAPVAEPAQQGTKDYRHLANEWADMACNGIQWLRNIRDRISKPEEALAEMMDNHGRIVALATPQSGQGTKAEAQLKAGESCAPYLAQHNGVKTHERRPEEGNCGPGEKSGERRQAARGDAAGAGSAERGAGPGDIAEGRSGAVEEGARALRSIDVPAARSGEVAVPELIDWVVACWHAEVANRPMVNAHRRTLDDTWRQVLRHLGVDDRERLGPTHDERLAAPSTGSEKP